MENNSKFTVAATSTKFNELYNDQAIITSIVPFNKMKAFLMAACQSIDRIFVSRVLIPHATIITFFAPQKSDESPIGFYSTRLEDRELVMADMNGARVQFHFYNTWTPAHFTDRKQKERSDKCKAAFPELSEALEMAFNETVGN